MNNLTRKMNRNELRDINVDLIDALMSLLNVEGAARIGAQSSAFSGLDVAYHFDKARAAIAKCDYAMTAARAEVQS